MSGPVVSVVSPADTDDVVLAAHRFLSTKTDVTSLLGGDSVFSSWLFTDTLAVEVAGSSKCALVLYYAGSWSAPNEHNTAVFPRLGITIYADPKRDSNGNFIRDDTRTKILKVHKALRKHMHLVDMQTVMWDDLRILASSCLNDPEPRPWEDGDHAASAQVFYALGVG